jgi:hypothetical protein
MLAGVNERGSEERPRFKTRGYLSIVDIPEFAHFPVTPFFQIWLNSPPPRANE